MYIFIMVFEIVGLQNIYLKKIFSSLPLSELHVQPLGLSILKNNKMNMNNVLTETLSIVQIFPN
jgi:hypothetical protein